jgi:hypothetical protein
MAVHELYLGGPSTANYSRAMFPSQPFVQAAEPFQSMRPAAHKGPNSFALNRVLDFGAIPSTAVPSGSDTALKHWEANATIVQGDALGVLIIPKHTLLLGVFFNVEVPAGVALSITPRLRTPAALFPVVDGNVESATWTGPGVAGAIAATGSAATVVPWFIAGSPVILELLLTTWTKFGNLRLEVSAIVQDLSSGQP